MILHAVHIVEFVNENMGNCLVIVLLDIRDLFKQFDGFHKEIVEIEGIVFREFVLIAAQDASEVFDGFCVMNLRGLYCVDWIL